VRSHLLDIGPDVLQRFERFVFFLPWNVECVMRVHFSRLYGRVEEMDFEVSEPHIDFLDLASLQLFFVRGDSSHHLSA